MNDEGRERPSGCIIRNPAATSTEGVAELGDRSDLAAKAFHEYAEAFVERFTGPADGK